MSNAIADAFKLIVNIIYSLKKLHAILYISMYE